MSNIIANERRQRPGYDIHPQHSEKEYWPITYIEPEESNRQAIGLDMAFERNRYQAVKRARDEGVAQLTGPIILVQDAEQTPGFLFYTPMYKSSGIPDTLQERQHSILGVTYAPFIMRELMKGTLAQENRHLRIKISDDGTLLYEDNPDEESVDVGPLFSSVSEVEMYGRTWRFDIESGKAFRLATNSSQPYIILVAGIIIDALLVGLFLFMTRMNRLALRYADQMTSVLEEKNTKLKQANKVKSEFLSVVSHELRTPLTSIHGALVLIGQMVKTLPDKMQEMLDIAQKNSRRLNRLVNDILDVEKLSEDRLDFEIVATDIDKLIKSIVKNQAVYCEQFQSNIILDGDVEGVYLNTDKHRLEQVLTNLLSNAIKFSPEGKDVVIRPQLKGDILRIEVIDQGSGIPDDFKDVIFERFTQVDSSSTRAVQGAGLGLYICKKIIMALGGDIGFTSVSGKGTVFYIEFDVKQHSS
ncbi:CHASE domain-containing protein [Endozoicomonas sp.]|uniref:CHASE domain-containing protein n=1 Tax=Endozoicomonas sp. TaxID=1892382 RepID=UPI003AF950D1